MTYSGPLEPFNSPQAPSIEALSGPDRALLADHLQSGTWPTLSQSQKAKLISQHQHLARALDWHARQASITPADRLMAALDGTDHEGQKDRADRQKIQEHREKLREMGFPSNIDEARADPAALLKLDANLTAKMLLARLPEAEQITSLATNYRQHIDREREKIRAEIARHQSDLEALQ